MKDEQKQKHKGKIGSTMNRAVLLDRDGTLIHDPGYLDDPDGIHLYDGAAEALKELKEAGYMLAVVTNQSGIGRGYFDEETGIAVNMSLAKELAKNDVILDAIYYCSHKPDERCRCRKPGTGMIERAEADLRVERKGSWMIGDNSIDVLAGNTVGLGTILVGTGKKDKGKVPENTIKANDIREAARLILEGRI